MIYNLKMKIFAVGCWALLALAVGGAWAQDGNLQQDLARQEKVLEDSIPKIPRMEFKDKLYNFQVVSQGDPVRYDFEFVNGGDGDLQILSLKSTCGCTAATASSGPYRPGEAGSVQVTYDTRGKLGYTTKEITVVTNDPLSPHVLTIEGTVNLKEDHPPVKPGEVLFQGSCAQCHSTPSRGKAGKELYDSTCHMCHDFPQENGRKWVAPNKFSLAKNSKRKLRKIISGGVPYSSMPAFALDQAGPLTKTQIDSLVDYIHSLRKATE